MEVRKRRIAVALIRCRLHVCVSVKRALSIWQKGPTNIRIPATYSYGKRDLFTWQKRPMCMAKEPCLYGERGLLTYAYLRRHRMHASVAKETCSHGKRALFLWQMRLVHMAKETY